MRRLGCFGIIVVILGAVIAYQQWRIDQLSSQLASIATKVHSGKASKAAAKNPDLASTLAEAQQYTRQAQAFLNSRNLAQAQADLTKAKQKLDAAGSFSKNIYDNSAEFLGNAEKRTVKVFHKAWHDISEQPKANDGKQQNASADKKQSHD